MICKLLSLLTFLIEQALQRHLKSLPEPPMLRENLKKEIKMFVEMLQQRTQEEGRYTTLIFVSVNKLQLRHLFNIRSICKFAT